MVPDQDSSGSFQNVSEGGQLRPENLKLLGGQQVRGALSSASVGQGPGVSCIHRCVGFSEGLDPCPCGPHDGANPQPETCRSSSNYQNGESYSADFLGNAEAQFSHVPG